jgi:hypothetical protein
LSQVDSKIHSVDEQTHMIFCNALVQMNNTCLTCFKNALTGGSKGRWHTYCRFLGPNKSVTSSGSYSLSRCVNQWTLQLTSSQSAQKRCNFGRTRTHKQWGGVQACNKTQREMRGRHAISAADMAAVTRESGCMRQPGRD